MSKPAGTKDIIKGNKKGLKPKQRELSAKQPNQWRSTPQQNRFMELWLTPNSPTFGKAYQSAIEAGYSRHYAMKISSPSINNKWLSEYERKLNFTQDHIRTAIATIATSTDLDSRSPADTNLKALEILAKSEGMIDSKSGVTVNVVQPILGGNSITKEDIISTQ